MSRPKEINNLPLQWDSYPTHVCPKCLTGRQHKHYCGRVNIVLQHTFCDYCTYAELIK